MGNSSAAKMNIAETIALTTLANIPACASGEDYERFEFAQVHMGVRVGITLYADSRAAAEAAAGSAYAAFAEVDQACSDYLVESELNRLCRRAGDGFIPVSATLFTVVEQAQRISLLTDGALDITISPLVRLWRAARQSGVLPAASDIASAKARIGWWKVRLDKATRAIALEPGVTIDLGGVAKGYGCDAALRALAAAGIRSAMVEAGGDIAVSGAPPGAEGWAIAIRGRQGPPLLVADGAVSTSGDSEQFVEFDGKRYSHIVDPFTGYGLTNRMQVTVFSHNGLTSDPLATTICVVGESRGRRLAKRLGAHDVIVIR
jgi:thiamine biosynthesis lipoprotein